MLFLGKRATGSYLPGGRPTCPHPRQAADLWKINWATDRSGLTRNSRISLSIRPAGISTFLLRMTRTMSDTVKLWAASFRGSINPYGISAPAVRTLCMSSNCLMPSESGRSFKEKILSESTLESGRRVGLAPGDKMSLL